MTDPRQKTQQNIPPRPRKERSLGAAAAWSLLVVLSVTITILLVEGAVPDTPIYNYWRLLTVNGQVSPGSELIRQLLDQINREDILFVTPVSLLCGGITLGRLAPRSLNRGRVLLSAFGVSGGIILTCLVFFWGLVLHDQHWHLHPGEIDTQKATLQTIAAVGWIIVCLIGTFGGLLWRDADHKRRSQPPPSTLTSSSR